MKRIAFILVCLVLAISANASAAPLQDYSSGKIAVDINLTDQNLKSTPAYWQNSYNLGFGVTAGLGNKWALQYKYYNWGASHRVDGMPLNTLASINELNLLYKIDKNFSAFVGANRLTGSLGAPIDTRTGVQIGLIGRTKLADKLTGWGLYATGNSMVTAELGLGYALSKQLDLNLFYSFKYFNGLYFTNTPGPSFNGRSQGLGIGVTATF